MQQDKLALRRSQAGMRFIAQMTIYNSENTERLRQFIADSYHDTLLQEADTETRLHDLQQTLQQVGKLRVKQVMATNEHQAIVVMQAQQAEGLFYCEVQVETDYPHKITRYLFQQMNEMNE
jgi:hypothetical protein